MADIVAHDAVSLMTNFHTENSRAIYTQCNLYPTSLLLISCQLGFLVQHIYYMDI